jgi:predicted transcriptional regulator
MKKTSGKGESIITQVTETTLMDSTTGEVLQMRREEKRKVSREPDFIKLYLNNIMLLNSVPQQKTDVLYLLLTRMNYKNEIVLVSGIKKEMAEELNCSLATIDKSLSLLVDKGVLKRKDRGIYIANPHLFGRGQWTEIEQLRLSLEFTKNYTKIGGFVKKKEIENNDTDNKLLDA